MVANISYNYRANFIFVRLCCYSYASSMIILCSFYLFSFLNEFDIVFEQLLREKKLKYPI